MRTTGVRCYELSKVRSNTDGGFHETTGGKADNPLRPRLSANNPKRTLAGLHVTPPSGR